MLTQRRYVLHDQPFPATIARHLSNIETPGEIEQREEKKQDMVGQNKTPERRCDEMTNGLDSSTTLRRRQLAQV
jgi:hypothetical protein